MHIWPKVHLLFAFLSPRFAFLIFYYFYYLLCKIDIKNYVFLLFSITIQAPYCFPQILSLFSIYFEFIIDLLYLLWLLFIKIQASYYFSQIGWLFSIYFEFGIDLLLDFIKLSWFSAGYFLLFLIKKCRTFYD